MKTSDKRWSCLIALLIATAALGCEGDEVRFGQPGGLRVRGQDEGTGGTLAPCPLVDEGPLDVCPDWEQDVFLPLLDDKYGCTTEGCHGAVTFAKNLALAPGDAAASYDLMAKYESDLTVRPYVQEDGQDAAYLLCNLNPDPAFLIGNKFMPIGPPVTQEDLVTIGNWARCGMKKTGGTPPGGGGGDPGSGGGGGAGDGGGGGG